MSPHLLARLSARRRETRRSVVESCTGRVRPVGRPMFRMDPWRVRESDYFDSLTLVRKGVLMQLSVAIGTAVNHAYQSGGDEDTLRDVATAIRATLPESDQSAFTEAVEMCGLLLPHVGHFSRLGGTWWCDTCDSPYCELA